MRKHPRDCYDEALIAFGGPVAGMGAAFAVAAGASMTDSQLLYALADFGFMINLFNMLPIGMMDGGRSKYSRPTFLSRDGVYISLIMVQ